MAGVASHRDLIVWQKAMDLAVLCYATSRSFPRAETYGLTSQLTRSAASVAANIAEGSGRGTPNDFAHFVAIAKGSLMETETFLTLAVRLSYVTEEETAPLFALITEISKMLTALRGKLRSKGE